MRHQEDRHGNLIVKPTRQDIEQLKVGDLALDCFGKLSQVESIFHRGEDIYGKLFACFRVDFGEGSTITASAKEDEFVVTVPLTREYSTSSNYPWDNTVEAGEFISLR